MRLQRRHGSRQPPHARQGRPRRARRARGAARHPGQRADRASSRSATSARAPDRSPASARPTASSSTRCRSSLDKGIASGGKTYPVEIITKDSQSSGSRASEVASELILRDKVDLIVARQHARHHQSGRRPGRGQRGALHHHQLPVAALFLRPQRRSDEGLHLDLSFLLGPRGRDRRVPGAVGRARRPTRWSAACSPTTPTAMPGAIPSSACRRRSPRPATS